MLLLRRLNVDVNANVATNFELSLKLILFRVQYFNSRVVNEKIERRKSAFLFRFPKKNVTKVGIETF